MFDVYVVFNNLDGKCYVGKTKGSYLRRWKGHIQASRTKKKAFYFQYAIAKHGLQAFTVHLLLKCTNNVDACKAEKYWILFYKSNEAEFGYNLTDGGEGPHGGKAFDAEHRRKLSESNRGKHDHRGERHPLWGKHHSDETRKKIAASNSIAQSGCHNPMFGKKQSEKTRQLISIALIGKAVGKRDTEETKRKKSLAKKLWWFKKKMESGTQGG